jgi:hypothetical protein
MSILNNLNFILDSFSFPAEQRDGSGYLPLLHFCMIFNPSVIRLSAAEQKEANAAITSTLQKIYQAYPPAAEINGPFVGNPINVLVGECSIAKTIQELVDNETCKRLQILFQRARDARALQTLCNIEKKVSLWAFFSLFDENAVLTMKRSENELVLDLNKEVIKGWR